MKKILIAYYSRKGENYFKGKIAKLTEGNTAKMAKRICHLVAADLFEITTLKPYPQSYHETTERAKMELKNDARPAIDLTNLPDISAYDIIFIGYPNWWGTMPMAVLTFLETADFTDKIIIPFCTHGGSGLGSSEKDIKRVAPQVNLRTGLAIYGDMVEDSDTKIADWIEKNIK